MANKFGEVRCDEILGFKRMPAGYELWLDHDGALFHWVQADTGVESSEHWDMWSAYKDAKRHSEKAD